jgi:hypothetical protein
MVAAGTAVFPEVQSEVQAGINGVGVLEEREETVALVVVVLVPVVLVWG